MEAGSADCKWQGSLTDPTRLSTNKAPGASNYFLGTRKHTTVPQGEVSFTFGRQQPADTLLLQASKCLHGAHCLPSMTASWPSVFRGDINSPACCTHRRWLHGCWQVILQSAVSATPNNTPCLSPGDQPCAPSRQICKESAAVPMKNKQTNQYKIE